MVSKVIISCPSFFVNEGGFMSNNVFGILAFSILVEAIVTYVNQFFVDGNFSWKMLLAIALGIIVAVAYNLDLPAHFNLKSQIPYIGCILTGILISRGSNFVFDIIKKLTTT